MTHTTPTIDEARRMPTFWRVLTIHRTSYSCPACAEHRAESWVDGTACPEHREESVTLADAPTTTRARRPRKVDQHDADLALQVLRAGGNPEPLTHEGTIAHAQWSYKPRGRKADRLEIIRALTHEPATTIAA